MRLIVRHDDITWQSKCRSIGFNLDFSPLSHGFEHMPRGYHISGVNEGSRTLDQCFYWHVSKLQNDPIAANQRPAKLGRSFSSNYLPSLDSSNKFVKRTMCSDRRSIYAPFSHPPFHRSTSPS